MLIEESDVSILIPSYNQKKLLINAINSALRTNAGEIIISDDHSSDGSYEFLLKLNHSRIKVIQPDKNIGLWANHLFLLVNCTKPWIKFLQQDDLLLGNGLKEMCKLVKEETVIVSCLPIYKSLSQNVTFPEVKLKATLRLSSDQFLKKSLRTFNILGTPSYTLIKKNALDLSKEAWRNDMSCDMTGNINVATQGEVVIIPPKYIIRGIHDGQDNFTQSPELRIARFTNSMLYLLKLRDERIIRLVSITTTVEFLFYIKGVFGLVNRKKKIRLSYLLLIIALLKFIRFKHVIRNIENIFFLLKFKIAWNRGLNLNEW